MLSKSKKVRVILSIIGVIILSIISLMSNEKAVDYLISIYDKDGSNTYISKKNSVYYKMPIYIESYYMSKGEISNYKTIEDDKELTKYFIDKVDILEEASDAEIDEYYNTPYEEIGGIWTIQLKNVEKIYESGWKDVAIILKIRIHENLNIAVITGKKSKGSYYNMSEEVKQEFINTIKKQGTGHEK